MLDAQSVVPLPVNEPVRQYVSGSPERATLETRVKELAADLVDLTLTIAGQQRRGGGAPIAVVQPHRHRALLGTTHEADAADVQAAIDAALAAAPAWRASSYDNRAVEPTVLVGSDPTHEVFVQEYFGPVLSVHVWDDPAPGAWEDVLRLVDSTAPFALTGAVFGREAYPVAQASEALRFSAGNFYVNDKPTGAVVGQQPFGGARASGTNDKAGSVLNLLRWTSPRTLKETLAPALDHRYPTWAERRAAGTGALSGRSSP